MHHDLKSILAGAALAALLIVPTLAHGAPAAPPTPPAPPAPVAQPVPADVNDAVEDAKAEGNWVTRPRKSFNVKKVHFSSVIGSIKVDVKDSGPMTLDVAGTKRAVDGLDVHVEDGT